jgi:5-methylthioadenosine/S-adenosylhomocysteine deaminase
MAWFREETRQARTLGLQPLEKGEAPSRLVLRGRIVTMDDGFTVIPDGYLAIESKRIVHIGPIEQPLPSAFSFINPIDTQGTLYPGLFELHNHPSYNAIPLWKVPKAFSNRTQWRADSNYKRMVSNPSTLLTHGPQPDAARAIIRFVECRSLLGGVTTTQGLSIRNMKSATKEAYAGLVRNVELPDDKSWPAAEDQINDFRSLDEALDSYGKIFGDTRFRFLMHMSEGTDDAARAVFEFLRRPDGSYLIGSNLVGIHATALNATQMSHMGASGGIVWSPLSNLLLYGATTQIDAAVKAGIPISIGSDWAPSGTKNLLGELQIARIVSAQLGGLFSDRDLARMVTSNPAKMMGWENALGSLEIGKLADCLILNGTSNDPYQQLANASESDIVAVLIDGRPRAGRALLIDPGTAGVEMLRVANQDIVLDIIDKGHPLEGMTLGSAISTLSYALEHLPDLAERFFSQHRLMEGATDLYYVELDMDEDHALDLMSGKSAIGRDDVEPMALDSITEVDDSDFRPRLKANINIPNWLRAQL